MATGLKDASKCLTQMGDTIYCLAGICCFVRPPGKGFDSLHGLICPPEENDYALIMYRYVYMKTEITTQASA